MGALGHYRGASRVCKIWHLRTEGDILFPGNLPSQKRAKLGIGLRRGQESEEKKSVERNVHSVGRRERLRSNGPLVILNYR